MRGRIEYKTAQQVRYMRAAGLVVADIHAALRAAVRPGVTLRELDRVSADAIARAGAHSNFKGYYGYPATVCISVNDTAVHGIPDDTVLRAGDLVSLDCGAYVLRGDEQWHGDACFSVIVGGDEAGGADARALNRLTERAMWAGVASLASGRTIACVGEAVEEVVAQGALDNGWEADIVQEYTGHGIGTAMHQEPTVLHYATRGRQARVRPGMVLCVEPILTRGSAKVHVMGDDWTVKTNDGQIAAHWEHQVAILPQGISVLTAPDCGIAGLKPYGITPVAVQPD